MLKTDFSLFHTQSAIQHTIRAEAEAKMNSGDTSYLTYHALVSTHETANAFDINGQQHIPKQNGMWEYVIVSFFQAALLIVTALLMGNFCKKFARELISESEERWRKAFEVRQCDRSNSAKIEEICGSVSEKLKDSATPNHPQIPSDGDMNQQPEKPILFENFLFQDPSYLSQPKYTRLEAPMIETNSTQITMNTQNIHPSPDFRPKYGFENNASPSHQGHINFLEEQEGQPRQDIQDFPQALCNQAQLIIPPNTDTNNSPVKITESPDKFSVSESPSRIPTPLSSRSPDLIAPIPYRLGDNMINTQIYKGLEANATFQTTIVEVNSPIDGDTFLTPHSGLY